MSKDEVLEVRTPGVLFRAVQRAMGIRVHREEDCRRMGIRVGKETLEPVRDNRKINV